MSLFFSTDSVGRFLGGVYAGAPLLAVPGPEDGLFLASGLALRNTGNIVRSTNCITGTTKTFDTISGGGLIPHPFSSGGAHITTTERLARFLDSPTLGGPDGLFVAPADQIDNLLENAANRAYIELYLGLERGALDGGDLVRFDVADPFSQNLRLPTDGNIHFRPGAGLTTGNLNEGIINSPLLSDPRVTRSIIVLP